MKKLFISRPMKGRSGLWQMMLQKMSVSHVSGERLAR